MKHLVRVVLIALTASACGADIEPSPFPEQYIFGGDRPAELLVPADYDPGQPTPLLVVLHGYSASGFLQLVYTGLRDLTDLADQGYLVIGPDGTRDSQNNRFWNATEACCDFDGSGVDDVAYLSDLIDEIRSVYNVDDQRIYFFGHSNGGFMSYRMACERADLMTAMVSLAGTTYLDPNACAPARAVSVLQIHGDLDDSILYQGNQAYPGAVDATRMWAEYNGCTGAFAADPARFDLDSDVAGDETRIERSGDCPAGIDVELWTLEGSGHIPLLQADFAAHVEEWLAAHPGSEAR